MKKTFVTLALTAAAATSAYADGHEVKIGVLLGYTGPIETLTPTIAWGAETAMAEVNESGGILDGHMVISVRGDTTCVDSAVASAAAERVVTVDRVHGIVGGDCSGVTGAILQNVARPNGIVMISPSATSPALSTAEDDGLFFRTAPSDARGGEALAEVVHARGFSNVAVTYTNNDYGKGLADSFNTAFEAGGGTVTIVASHEDGKGDYSAEVGALAAAGGEVLVVIGYIDQGGFGIVQGSLDTGAFDTFVFPDGMIGDSITDKLGSELNGSFGQAPGTDSDGSDWLLAMGTEQGFDAKSPYAGEAYDAAALIMLAMQSASSTDSNVYKDHVTRVANAPGEIIKTGELGKAIALIREGVDIDYQGASDVELIGPGESSGRFAEYEIQNGEFVIVNYR